eukprot:CAMPEP_0113614720 /NCGR_PEP_ID=MMETSP0017_2-20120614/7320_1 /TAXON_ID=2856 /ORGANISM="Cylindrotheca closterium" /LENGTH=315 /DNA_ID=CAMNT_0000523913 /DNA_START=77 /DNA_END=1024 /DNA_ORIENTATION=+ /assembly_acc=CAM_ASM_000147
MATKIDEEQLMNDMLSRVRAVNNMPQDIRSTLLDFKVDGCKVGIVRPGIAEMLCNMKSSVFELKEESDSQEQSYLTLTSDAGTSSDERTEAVGNVMNQLRDEGFIRGWRDELYPVSETFNSPAVFLMERTAVTLLGITEYGVHINGIVQESRKEEPKMWIARRSATKSKFPGMLDHIVAGGQPAGISLIDNVVKECEEEAGIEESIVRAGVQPVGAISYENWDPKTDKLTRCVLFNYDLYLPPDFEPKPVDGEVQGFMLWSMDQIKESMASDYADPIKPNCYVVIIDYLLRTGQISPDSSGYLDILRELRSGDCQ